MDYILLHLVGDGRGIIIPISSIEKVLEIGDGSTLVVLMKENIHVSEEIDFIYKKLEPMYLDDWSYFNMNSMLNVYKKMEETEDK